MNGIQKGLATLATVGTLGLGLSCGKPTKPRDTNSGNNNTSYTLDTKIKKLEVVHRGGGLYYLNVIVEGTPHNKVDKFLVYIDNEDDRHAFGGSDYTFNNGTASARMFIHCGSIEYPYYQDETASCPGTHNFVIAAYNIMDINADKTPARKTYRIP